MFKTYIKNLKEIKRKHPVLFWVGLGFYLVFLALCVYIDLRLYGVIKSK